MLAVFEFLEIERQMRHYRGKKCFLKSTAVFIRKSMIKEKKICMSQKKGRDKK